MGGRRLAANPRRPVPPEIAPDRRSDTVLALIAATAEIVGLENHPRTTRCLQMC